MVGEYNKYLRWVVVVGGMIAAVVATVVRSEVGMTAPAVAGTVGGENYTKLEAVALRTF